MLRWAIVGIVTTIVAIVSAVRSTPLEYAMTQAGLPNLIVSWSSAQGTITKGRLNTVLLGPQLIGDILVQQRFINPFNQSITYEVQWGSAGGRGTGKVAASSDRLKVQDLRVQQNVVAMPGLIPAIRELGGSIRILNGAFEVDRSGCLFAEGVITTDLLSRLGNQYGRSFTELRGPVSCAGGRVLIELKANSNEGDNIDISGSIGVSGTGEFNISVETVDPELRLVLQEYGFKNTDGNVWRYRHQT